MNRKEWNLMDIFFEYTIAPANKFIRKFEKEAKELFDHVEEKVKTQTIMVIRELLENAVKYGEIRPSVKDINISCNYSATLNSYH